MNHASNKITFTWSPVAPTCPSLHYNILSTNCGSCPTTTTNTTVTCTDVPTDGSLCTFAVQTFVCGNVDGNFSDLIHVALKDTSMFECSFSVAITSTSMLAGISFVYATLITGLVIIIIIRGKRQTTTRREKQEIT